ncbi:MAG TPA: hypothetical protein VEG61_08240 [Candidatus Dormibacteraeota bacterium]|jgi:Icc-related predicted phosphoesterase|nr:hypothetical protein [Candidatus Dormibacteraeota bacterium]
MPISKTQRHAKKLTNIFFATDLHASGRRYEKLLRAAKFYEVDASVLGGNLTGKHPACG